MDGLLSKTDTAKSLICLFVPVNGLSNFVVSSVIMLISKVMALGLGLCWKGTGDSASQKIIRS